MAKLSEQSPSTNVARFQISVSTPFVGLLLFLFLAPSGFSPALRFSPLLKTNTSNFRFDPERT